MASSPPTPGPTDSASDFSESTQYRAAQDAVAPSATEAGVFACAVSKPATDTAPGRSLQWRAISVRYRAAASAHARSSRLCAQRSWPNYPNPWYWADPRSLGIQLQPPLADPGH